MGHVKSCSSWRNQWEGFKEEDVEEPDPANLFRTETYHYDLPPDLIAQEPLQERDQSRLMVLHRQSGFLQETSFCRIREFLQEGDLIVINNSRVFPARLLGRKATGGRVDLLLLSPLPVDLAADSVDAERVESWSKWHCLIRSSRRPKAGQKLFFRDDVQGEVLGEVGGGVWTVFFNSREEGFTSFLEEHGLTPLPSYIKREQKEWPPRDSVQDRMRYQTVFAKETGSVAAPTAGMHFSDALLRELAEAGIRFAEITLHVGQATFLPIRTQDLREHSLWPERFSLPRSTCEEIERAKKEKRRVIAVGTTVVRCLESRQAERGCMEPGEGWTSLYILPGFRFQVVDALITNFHLPKSSLLVLVSAFAGKETIQKSYQEAVKSGYRFFSYGDCMFIQ